ncbi:MAG: lipid-A-disaccharide synthase-related protein [Drouetiella hepatica Uher 2000/2452]|jgi:uncharacterized protein (TIGR03492 family)|uniref:Lipid-A-disaccharide synthase-related protein n=1 Tax=Drouetiella hepatica Uher 2000/2452 TaxID=904376 RepID=A0A951QBM3_9CYAN|nr:lipid-A-disaccharide synthase-related protein [Drouetiella hepatica Uher 2000/2452]
MRLLCLSNGHGEDAIALRILQALQQDASLEEMEPMELAALPIVGEGQAYKQHGIPVIGESKSMPSGGFLYMDGRQLARDLQGGLLSLTRSQLHTIKTWARQGGMILAVGDIVPLLFAWWSGIPYAFVGTAKSEYYLQDEQGVLPRPSWFEQLESSLGSVYLPWERWLMKHPRCRAVFPRDRLTAEVLRRYAIRAFDLGNPMMDGLEPTGLDFLASSESLASSSIPLTIALLPGSRVSEAYENWQIILQAVAAIRIEFAAQELLFLAAIAPSLDLAPLQQMLEQADWQKVTSSPAAFRQKNATLIITTAFNDCIHQGKLAIAMAGTATEQFVGLGKPAIVMPGKGPQFTPKFAEAQTRLLGISVSLVASPEAAAGEVRSLLQDAPRLQRIAENGCRRMGESGAASRIADCLNQIFSVEAIQNASS